MTAHPKFAEVFNVTELSKTVDFINFYSWDLMGIWNGWADFANSIRSTNPKSHTLVGEKTSIFFLLTYEQNNCNVSNDSTMA